MRTCLFYVASHPECYHRLQKEVDDFYANNDMDSRLSYSQTRKMPYLQAVVKEATRLLPSIVFQLLRSTPSNFVVRGMHIPVGTTIGISPIAQNRDPEIWGADANEFHPERWLEDEERAKVFESATMTFGGSGPRMCVGRNIALVSPPSLMHPHCPSPMSACHFSSVLTTHLDIGRTAQVSRSICSRV